MSKPKRTKKPAHGTGSMTASLRMKARKIAAHLHISGRHPHLELFKLKTTTNAADLFSLFPLLFRDRNYLNIVHGIPFPTKLSELFSAKALYEPASALNEVTWAICRCLHFGPELREFNQFRESFERAFLLDSQRECTAILDSVEQKFGSSIWLLQNKLSTAQFWSGIEELRRLVRAYEEESSQNRFVAILLWFIARRTEATGLKDHLKSELNRLFEHTKEQDVESYLRAKIFELPNISTKDVPGTLLIEAQSCIIDYYETLIFVLQSAASDQTIPPDVAHILEKPLAALMRKTRDSRILGIMRGLGVVPDQGVGTSPDRAKIIESYTVGDYDSVLSLSSEYLNRSPEDISIQVLSIKAGLHRGCPPTQRNGILQTVSEHLQKVLSISNDTYLSAYNLLTLTEQFYGQSWIQYLRCVVVYELRQEQQAFPPLSLRDLFIRDPHVSPFTAIASTGKAKSAILGSGELQDSFPHTWAAYSALTRGEVSKVIPIDEIRLNKYLARFHLGVGNSGVAKNHFEWLITHAKGTERLRSYGGAALAFLNLGNVRDAVDATVRAFIEYPDLPNILPIKEVADQLEDPASWPDTIAVPLLFELFVTNCAGDRLSHLRYAFEKFQLRNNIDTPSDLALRIDAFGKQYVIAYLDRVWRPEIMRQTILYQGTREIEDARIKVCRLLAELDPPNSSRYLEEIKERVKKLEIAKGTTLIQQSKVYVDVEAIKKSLRSKLGDSYARYKSSANISESKADQLVFELAEAIARGKVEAAGISVPVVLSSLHAMGYDSASESDVQFEALFSEVTNEFLRGAHGLNAYLSTRVRHGTLSNTLRKSVADETLVTQREEGGATYVRNEYWKQNFGRESSCEAEWEDVLNALDEFSCEFDSIIEYVTNNLIQIRIVHELKESGENKEALFVYRSSNLERKFVQECDRNITNMDDFITYCVDILWQKTDHNLANVRHVLDTDIRDRIMGCFATLSNRLSGCSYVPGVGDILNAIARARTSTQTKLGLVISWFKRSEVYDRQDYAPDFPFHIALNMVTNTISSASGWEGATVKTVPSVSLMPGRTLDGMVYIFYGLLENAILRSGLDIDTLNVTADISFSSGVFNAKIINSVAPERLTDEEREKVRSLRDSLDSSESPRRAQLEGRSGLHKIWLTINSPLYRDPVLKFYHTDLAFVVEVGFKLENSENEYLAH